MTKQKYLTKQRDCIVYNGVRFDHIDEYRRYLGLIELEKEGVIRNLRAKPTFPLVLNGVYLNNYRPSFQFEDTKSGTNHVVVVKKGEKVRPSNPKGYILRLFETLYNITVEIW